VSSPGSSHAASHQNDVRERLPADTVIPRLLQRLRTLDESHLPLLYVEGAGIGALTPVGFGGSPGDVAVWLSYQERTRFGRYADGAIGAQASLGRPDVLGVDAGVAILDLRKNNAGRGGFGHRGSFNLKVHRRLGTNAAVAAGLQNIVNWGGTDLPWSAYVVASARSAPLTRRDSVSGRLYGSVGLGNGQFDARNGTRSIGVFANLAVSVAEPLRLFGEWSGQNLGVGGSLVPFRGVPAVVTVALVDLTHTAGDGERLMVGATYRFSLR